MKKVFVIALVLLSALVLAVYDASSERVSYSLKKGWNLISWTPGDAPDSIGGTCGEYGGPEQSKWLGWYTYSPTLGRHVLIGPPSPGQERIEQDLQAGYFYPALGGMFARVSGDCEFSSGPYSAPIYAAKIAQGWQFIPKRPDMSDFESTFQECEVTKLNAWNSANQAWVYRPSKVDKPEIASVWNSGNVGEVFLMKFAAECALTATGVPAAPSE